MLQLVYSGFKSVIPKGTKTFIKKKLGKYKEEDKVFLATGITKITTDDVFIVSYPKSGNTWVRFIIANLISRKEEVSFRNIEKYVQDDNKSKPLINSLASPRFIKSHALHFKHFPKFIYIIRDGRDVMVSYYHYQVSRKRFSGTFSEFIRSERVKIYGQWHEHVTNAMKLYYAGENNILLLKYERMLEDPYRAVKKIATFCNIEATNEEIIRVVENCSFNSLKENESKYGSELSANVNLNFFRSGKNGNWKDMFSEEDHDFFLWHSSEVLIKNGYDICY